MSFSKRIAPGFMLGLMVSMPALSQRVPVLDFESVGRRIHGSRVETIRCEDRHQMIRRRDGVAQRDIDSLPTHGRHRVRCIADHHCSWDAPRIHPIR